MRAVGSAAGLREPGRAGPLCEGRRGNFHPPEQTGHWACEWPVRAPAELSHPGLRTQILSPVTGITSGPGLPPLHGSCLPGLPSPLPKIPGASPADSVPAWASSHPQDPALPAHTAPHLLSCCRNFHLPGACRHLYPPAFSSPFFFFFCWVAFCKALPSIFSC